MADTKRLAFSIIQFLHDQLSSGSLSSDAQESLEVAIQCLETSFGISVEDQSLAVSPSLPEIFASATKQQTPQNKTNSSSGSPSEEQLAEAEHLKTDGNDQMKVENFGAAVVFYSKAIQLNPQNAVYYCNRAAAYSKLGNYAGAVQDCEQAIGIDPNYSKAYGRMGLALASLNKYSEAVSYYKKALELDPDNDTYKANLQIAEQKMKEAQPSPAGGLGGVELAGLLSNPGFMNMASNLMNNPQITLPSFKSRHFKLSIDMFLMSVCEVFAEFRFILVTRFRKKFAETEKAENATFVFFILQKHNVLLIL
uniref:Small glutamine-rich tetratricopeptide repeat-containing protein alpha n=1 Tax=Sinocyclocheilus rhinocerous TaxID=307959 RepID=A0A673GBQ6_9TELE